MKRGSTCGLTVIQSGAASNLRGDYKTLQFMACRSEVSSYIEALYVFIVSYGICLPHVNT
jgi:hypothetical protein